MTAPYGVGDKVKIKSGLFKEATIIFIREDGTVDLDTEQNKLTLYGIAPEDLEKIE